MYPVYYAARASYLINKKHGHEMINEFTEFLNDQRVILVGENELSV
jgi:hypothetical protein